VQTFESLKGGNVAAPLRHIRAGGTYLLTGIWSGIGFAVAEYLAKEFKAKLIILDNATFPPRDEWARMIKTHSEAEPLTWKMQALLSLEESGAETHLFTADLTNVRELREVVEQAHRRCGEISGAFHMEEPAEHGLVELKHQPGPGNDFDIKVKGTLALEAAFEHRPLDFLVLFSSVTSIAPGSGQVSECAANAFLDAFAQAKYMWSRRTHVMAVNWPAWRSGERQEGVPEGSAQPQSPLQQEREQYGITPQEGVEALRRILLLPMPQVVVSTQDFPAVVERLHSPTLADAPVALERLNSSASAPGLTALDGDYVPPRSTVEKILADVWQELFGIQRIGIHDDFLRLGGHSLLAVQLITRVRQAFSIELPLTSLFTAPTIAGLAEQITAQQLTPEELEEIEQIYGEIDNLSTGEVQRQLAEELRRGEGRSTHEPIL
jgi:acyl carrier protein/NAD(P)-dependent dehydrogenase (short-subunit alcohol dehydrogenase family)